MPRDHRPIAPPQPITTRNKRPFDQLPAAQADGTPAPGGGSGGGGGGGAPAAHAPTHNTGGSDPITNLSASILLSGTLPDARLSANVPLKNAANIFTADQTINGAVHASSYFVGAVPGIDFVGGVASLTVVKGIVTAATPGSGVTFPITPAQGGTGLTSFAIGDLIVATGVTTLARLANAAVGSLLVSSGPATPLVWSQTARFLCDTGLFGPGGAGAPSIAFVADSDTGLYNGSSGQLNFMSNGAPQWRFGSGFFQMQRDHTIEWSPLTVPASGSDVTLSRAGAGQLGLTGSLFATGSLVAGAGAFMYFNGRTAWQSPVDGKLALGPNVGTTGVLFDLLTNGTLKVRNYADSADAVVTAATAAPGTSTTQLATTAFVGAAVAAGGASIGGGVTGGTPGAVLFVKAGPVLGQDATKLFYDVANTRLGLGIGAPAYQLDVRATSIASIAHFGNSAADDGGYLTTASGTQFFFSAGAAFSGAAWVAKNAAAALFGLDTGRLRVFTDTGLTVGGTFAPTMILDATKQGITSPTQPRCSVYLNAAQSIPTGVYTPLLFDSEDYDIGGLHSTVTNTTRVTVPAGGDGLYFLWGYCLFTTSGTTTGTRAVVFLKNGVTVGQQVLAVPDAVNAVAVQASLVVQLVAGDFIELAALQGSGGNLNTGAGGAANRSAQNTLQVVKLW